MEETDPRAALARLVAESGESLAALSRLLGRNPAYLQQFVGRGSPRRLDERDRRVLAAYFGVDEALLGGPDRGTAPALIAVPRVDVDASAGPGGLAEDDRVIGAGRIDPALIRALGVRAADLSLVRAAGDSMLPGIAAGDEMLVDRGDRRIVRGRIYVIRSGGTVMVKRLSREGDTIAIASDNPAFETRRCPTGEVEVIGRVVWLARAMK